MTSLVTSPLDVVKTRLQSAALPSAFPSVVNPSVSMARNLGSHACDVCGASGGSTSAAGRGFAGASPFRGVPPASAVSTLLNVVRREGILTLWSGLKPSLIMAVPSTTLYFAAYDELKGRIEAQARGHGSGSGPGLSGSGHSQYNSNSSSHSSSNGRGVIPLAAAPLVAGVAGRVFAVTVVSPLELLRTREMYRRSHTPLLSALAAEVRANGGRVSSLWRGFAATLWRDVPFSGIYWLSYEGCKARLRDWRLQSLAAETNSNAARIGGGPMHRHTASNAVAERASAAASSSSSVGSFPLTPLPPPAQLGFLDTFAIAFASGVVSGGLAALLTTPFDVVKTRRQVDASRGTGAGTAAGGAAVTAAAGGGGSATTAAVAAAASGSAQPTGAARPPAASAAATASASVIAEHGTLGSLACIARTEGLRGLFAGVTARVAKVAPSCAIMIASYEIGKRFLGTMAENDSRRDESVRSGAAEPAPWAPTAGSRAAVAGSHTSAVSCERWRDGGINVVDAEEETPPT